MSIIRFVLVIKRWSFFYCCDKYMQKAVSPLLHIYLRFSIVNI